jgi:Rieske Fe-S protein
MHNGHQPPPHRRTFLGFLTNALGAIFSVVLGAPIVAYLINPRHLRANPSNFKVAEGVNVDQLEVNRPVQGVVRDVRADAFTYRPSEVLGRVWVVKQGNASRDGRPDLLVFTTICPHLGCSVNLNQSGVGSPFLCPCHAASFALDGSRVNPGSNVAQRGMDTLEWQVEGNRLLVKYQNFKANSAEKTPT